VKRRDCRECKHRDSDDKPTSATETKADPRKSNQGEERNGAALELDAKRERSNSKDKHHEKLREEYGGDANNGDEHPKAFCLVR